MASKKSKLHLLLQFCARWREPMKGKACHAQVICLGLTEDTLTSNILINLYSKCGLIEPARKVFDRMPERSLVSWNTIINAYANKGEEQNAFSLFVEMRKEGYPLNEFTISSVICACAGNRDIYECKQLHGFAIKTATDANEFIGAGLLDIYAKCGLIEDAHRIFEGMPNSSSVTWRSMVVGLVQNELYEEALAVFTSGQVMGLEYNQFTVTSVICACGGLGALIAGKQVHAVILKVGFGSNHFVSSSLVDMYSKCGALKVAFIVFMDVERKEVVLWNVMISGFAKHSCSLEVMILFEKMQQMGVWPDDVTYVSVLSACSHSGLVSERRIYFDLMTREHNVSPTIVHYSCMVDGLGRAGRIQEAYELIKTMPFIANAPMWGSLLASCRVHGNTEVAEVAAKNLFEMEPTNAGNYILLANMYAANKSWDKAAKARKFLRENEVVKEIGKSWIEMKNKVHTFVSGEEKHSRISEIYLKLDELVEGMKKLGYRVASDNDLHDVEESRKQEFLRHHSEKIAFTFGHICLPPNTSITIMKNLRICGDCHSFMKFASSITGREIIVRDLNRFHHFRNGCCSCRDFW